MDSNSFKCPYFHFGICPNKGIDCIEKITKEHLEYKEYKDKYNKLQSKYISLKNIINDLIIKKHKWNLKIMILNPKIKKEN